MTPEEADHCAKEVQAELKGGKVQQCLKVRLAVALILFIEALARDLLQIPYA